LKAAGAEVVIALCHSGISAAVRAGGEENAALYLAGIDGIDAIVTGHQHLTFPGHKSFDGLAGVDNKAGTLAGKPVEDLKDRPLQRESFTLYDFDNRSRPERTGKIEAIVNHMGNFFDCVAARRQPIADVEAGHRSVTACHLGSIACKLGRKLMWDPAAERFVGDAEADAMLSRPQRPGFEVRAGH
jgi:hypothetical protein